MIRHPKHGFALAALAVAVYALMWVGYRSQWHWLDAMDSAVMNPMHDYGVHHPGWVRFWNVFCTVFGPEGFRLVGLIVVVIAVLRRNLRVVLFLLATIGLSGAITNVAKALAGRPRPPTALVHAAFSSFPSGHAVEVMAAVLALLTISAGLFRPSIRVVTVVAGALIVITVGIGRVVLNVHHISDVLAGWALGYLWFFVCLLVIRPTRAAPDPGVSVAVADERPGAPGTAR